MARKQANELVIRREASLAAMAWSKLQVNAQAVLNGGDASTSVRLVADSAGIVAHIRDAHGCSVLIENGKVSVIAADDMRPRLGACRYP